MKSTESKPTPSHLPPTQQALQPFFKKEGEGLFFSKENSPQNTFFPPKTNSPLGRIIQLNPDEIRLDEEDRSEGSASGETVRSDAAIQAAAKSLQTAMSGWGTDEDAVYAALAPFSRNDSDLTRLRTAYRALTGSELQADIEDEMSGAELERALNLLLGNTSPTTGATAGAVAGGSLPAYAPASLLPEQVIGRNNTPLYFSPFDDILDIAPITLLNRGARVRIINNDPSSVSSLVEVVGTPQRGYIYSFFDSPLMETGEYQTLESYLDFNSGWHTRLPQSTLRAGSITYAAGSRGSAPRLRGSYPADPQMQALTSPQEEAARSTFLSYVRHNLASIRIPTATGHLVTSRGGYVYTASSNTDAASTGQREFTREMNLTRLGYASPSARVRGMWEQFQRVSRHEGDTSAINAWDDQIVTIGAGISALSGNAGSVYNRMPPQARQNLYECGIRVNEDNSFTVLDINRGVVETGTNALRLIQVDQRMLAALIQLAQSQETMTQSGSTMTAQEWMARSQFEWFMQRNSGVPDSVFTWRREARQFAFLLGHWSGALSWRGMGATGGDVNQLARYAANTILGVKPDWGAAYIQGRIRGIAVDSGVTETLSF
jgi:hypothetical protein